MLSTAVCLALEKDREMVGPESKCSGHEASMKTSTGKQGKEKNARRTSMHHGAI